MKSLRIPLGVAMHSESAKTLHLWATACSADVQMGLRRTQRYACQIKCFENVPIATLHNIQPYQVVQVVSSYS